MAEYNAPGVYMESVSNTAKSVTGTASDTFGFVGVTPRGSVTEPIYVTSWNNFIEKCAGGLSSPFLADYDLAYAMYGFFQNGGTKAYISRVANSEVAKATASSDILPLEAKDEGTWGNNLKVAVQKNVINDSNFDIIVKLGNTVVEKITDVVGDKTKYNYVFDTINGSSNYITVTNESGIALAVTESDITFSGGNDGLGSSGPVQTDYDNAIDRLKQVDELGFICVPGNSESYIVNKLKEFVESKNRYTFAVIDMPKGTLSNEQALAFRKTINSDSMAVIGPYGYVTDPLSASGRLRLVPPTGHWCGYEAKNIQKNGIQKAPAGTEASITGFVNLERNITVDDLETLNPAGIISIINKKNYGIVVWGCRSCSSNPDYRYITDKLVDNYIDSSIYKGTQWAVFEENDPDLWEDLVTSITEFLENCRNSGVIKGNTPETSYYVNCNEDLNTETVQKSGKVICEYGFAKKKPAEFVVHRVDHNMSATSTETV